MSSKVSVIIPTFNRKTLVLEAIASIRRQIHKNIEIIVVDDGSSDGTAEAIGSHAPDIKLIVQKNSGVSGARNAGIQQADSEWIAFLDSDDLWLSDKLQKQLSRTTAEGALISYTNEIWYRNGRRVNPKKRHQKYSGDIFERCLPLCMISASSILIHRSVFEKVGLFDEKLPVCEDYDLWLRISLHYPILYRDELFIIKRNGVDQRHLSKKFWGIDRFRIQSLEKILDQESLNDTQRGALLAELKRKRAIFLKGAQKIGNSA